MRLGRRDGQAGQASQAGRASQRGQVTIIMAMMMVLIVGVAGLAIDGGVLYLSHRRLQSAADLAALAGAVALTGSGDEETLQAAAVAAAIDVASKNGQASPDATVTVNVPPASGSFADDDTCVEVIVERPVETYLTQLLGFGEVTVRARAVAQRGRGTAPYAIFSTSTSASPAIDFSGGGDTITSGAGIMSNSTSADAIKHTGGGSVLIDGPVSAVGGVNQGSPILVTAGYAIRGGAPTFPDPFTSLAGPTYGSPGTDAPTIRATTNVTVRGSDTCIVPNSAWQDPSNPATCRTFGAGVYQGGISVTGGAWSLAAGIYVIAGGGLKITGGDVTGYGVFIYNTSGPGSAGPITINTTGTVQLSPSSTPLYAGMPANLTVYQDRALTGSSTQTSITGYANTRIMGTLYIPTNLVKVTGGGDLGIIDGQIIADRMQFGGGSDKTIVYHKESVAYRVGATLVE